MNVTIIVMEAGLETERSICLDRPGNEVYGHPSRQRCALGISGWAMLDSSCACSERLLYMYGAVKDSKWSFRLGVPNRATKPDRKTVNAF